MERTQEARAAGIRRANAGDLSRVAEIFVFNNRINYFPIFQDPQYSFGTLQVVPLVDRLSKQEGLLDRLYVCDDGVVKGFLLLDGTEICKLYVDPCFQSEGIGRRLLEYAVAVHGADRLWALEKNTRAIAFYRRNGFRLTGDREPEEGTAEYRVALCRAVQDADASKRL